jgi:hypothetical protein
MVSKEYYKDYYAKNKNKLKKQMLKNYKKNKPKRLHYQKVKTSEKAMEKKYDRPIKNLIRDRLIKEISNYNIKNILTLESSDFLFSKELIEKKIYVYEKDKETFNKMLRHKQKNIVLSYGNISEFSNYDFNIDCIYLDFCGSYTTEKEIIYNLKDKIKNCKLFAVTFCTWDETKEANGDYQFDLLNKLQTLIGIPFKVIFGQGYRDKKHSTMVTILLENPEVK